jgi:hypothetical protein
MKRMKLGDLSEEWRRSQSEKTSDYGHHHIKTVIQTASIIIWVLVFRLYGFCKERDFEQNPSCCTPGIWRKMEVTDLGYMETDKTVKGFCIACKPNLLFVFD